MSEFVRNFYNRVAEQEWQRLEGPLCKVEFVSTLHLIDKYFPERGSVCDIGGGPGRYTIELLKRGHRVTLLDLSEEEIAIARTRLDKLGLKPERLIVGDARDLSALASESFDAALLLGPMYHVIDQQERIGILHGLKRLLKPNGIAIIAYLNSWGLMKTGIVDFPNWYKDVSILRDMLKERICPAQTLSGFTECYWSTPESALLEIKTAGLDMVSYAGAESFAGGMGPLLKQLSVDNPTAYANVLQVAAETCELAQYRDSTDHLHIVVQKKLV